MKLTIDHNIIKALLPAASKDATRGCLVGVCVDARASDQSVTLVATNGALIIAVPVPAGCVDDFEAGEWIVPLFDLEAVKPCKAGRTTLPCTLTVTVDPDKPDPTRPGVTILGLKRFEYAGTTTSSGIALDGKYADWRRTFPATASLAPALFSQELLTIMDKARKALGGEGPVRIHYNGAGAALVTGLGRDATGVMMPMRVPVTEHPGLPSWAKQ